MIVNAFLLPAEIGHPLSLESDRQAALIETANGAETGLAPRCLGELPDL
jgi:hypothetical protein